MGEGAFQGRARRGLAAALLLLAAPLALTACTPTTYAGISLKPGAADPELQDLARRAQAGDKYAQLELGIRYEEGRGVPLNLRRAEEQFLAASLDTGGAIRSHSRVVPGTSNEGVVILNVGPLRTGLPEARSRWILARSRRIAEEASAAAPSDLALEVYLSQRLRSDLQLGAPNTDRSGILRINGPAVVSGHFTVDGPPKVGGELCDQLASLIRGYRDFGFNECSVWRYMPQRQSPDGHREPVYLLYYVDQYTESEEYQSSSLDLPYRPPFSIDPAIFSWEEICGKFNSFAITTSSGDVYRVIVNYADAGQRQRAAGC